MKIQSFVALSSISIVALVVTAAAAVSPIPRANAVFPRLEARYFADQLFPRALEDSAVVEPHEYVGQLLARRAHPRDFCRRQVGSIVSII